MTLNILSLLPSDTPEYMAPAWLGAIHYALGQPEIVERFRQDTGNKWSPGKTAFDKAIDKATGADEAFFVEFIKWANVEVWGPLSKKEDEGDA